MNLNLLDKVVMVTGASRGLGYSAALAFAHEGANLVINSRNSQNINSAARKINEQTGRKVVPVSGDITSIDTPRELISTTIKEYGKMDVLIVNAGGPRSGSFEDFDDKDWSSAIDLCFLSQVRIIRDALPLLKKSNSASVITITSYSAKQPIENLILSNSLRLAMVGLTKSLALELGHLGIRVNSILPAWTDTERVTELMEYRAKKNGTTVDREKTQQAKDSPLGRMGTPEEVANAIVFLSSPAASYITGLMLTVDGGMYKGTF